MVYFDHLNWRSAGTVGHPSLYLFENDTGPDDSVHSMDGIFMMYKPGVEMRGMELKGATAQDIAPTLLTILGIDPVAEGFGGKVLSQVVKASR
jgi:predicted AlkP superfamily phosphohydrolase/phosphomutase